MQMHEHSRMKRLRFIDKQPLFVLPLAAQQPGLPGSGEAAPSGGSGCATRIRRRRWSACPAWHLPPEQIAVTSATSLGAHRGEENHASAITISRHVLSNQVQLMSASAKLAQLPATDKI